jgi:hypothetical protein
LTDPDYSLKVICGGVLIGEEWDHGEAHGLGDGEGLLVSPLADDAGIN